MTFNIILEKAEEGGYNVKVPALDGCFTQGDSLEEAIENSKEAIACYIEGLQKGKCTWKEIIQRTERIAWSVKLYNW